MSSVPIHDQLFVYELLAVTMNKRLVIAILVLLAILAVGIVWRVPRNTYLMTFVEQLAPGVIPASSYARNLNSSDPDVVRESLAHLTDRKDPIAAARAVELLKNPNDYIWLNAAHYTGVCGRQEAVPYLIKSLRHTAWRADNKAAQYLRSLTGQDYGIDFPRWQKWWLETHPDSAIDWTSHLGFSPRLSNAGTDEGSGQDGPANRSQPTPVADL